MMSIIMFITIICILVILLGFGRYTGVTFTYRRAMEMHFRSFKFHANSHCTRQFYNLLFICKWLTYIKLEFGLFEKLD